MYINPSSLQGKSKKKETKVNQGDITSLADLLTAKFNAGMDDVLSKESQTQITEACQNLSVDEGEAAVKMMLLYMRTHALCAIQVRSILVVFKFENYIFCTKFLLDQRKRALIF